MKTFTKLYTTSMAAEFCGCTSSRIRQKLINGEMKGEKVGTGWLIRFSEVKRFAAQDSHRGRPRSGRPKK